MAGQAWITAREKLLENMVRYFKQQSGVMAIFVSGSVAEGTADCYSDIDFRVVVEKEALDFFIANKFAAPLMWGELMFNEYNLDRGRNVCVSHFKPFNKVDVFYYAKHDLIPSPWHNKGIKIIHDPFGIVRQMRDDSSGMQVAYTQEQAEALINKALACAHEVFRRANRGEIVYAMELLGEFRSKIIEADDMLHHRLPEGFSHFEKRGGPELVSVIHASYCSGDKQKILQSLNALILLFKGLLVRLEQNYELSRDLPADMQSLDFLAKRSS